MVTLASHALFAGHSKAVVARPVATAKIYAHAKYTVVAGEQIEHATYDDVNQGAWFRVMTSSTDE